MVPSSLDDALGSYATTVREVVVDVVRTRHNYSADAHQAAHTRNTRGYSTLWQDLLVDVQEAFSDRGHQLHKLVPAGHRVPIVNGCLVYVWRVPASGDPARFATSPTKMSSFGASLPDNADEESAAVPERSVDLEALMSSTDGTMPVVLVMVHSSPRQLQAIDWAVAELDRESGEVTFRGEETIWQPELAAEVHAPGVERFDSGAPVPPAIEPRKQEGTDSDA
ncbi:MAG: hypothetical protein L0H31_08800 [Nocardioidaceae bacterium]|nr:hypothetical protein [Nocardioidaceae bacterium]